ncbi:MAG: type II toxin-antitoxin system RelE/ParE family toxin [Methanosarcinales archaeon]|nr:type II toxin-antitoxin system RelE/ParE family toxin [Methanosarcinales archaeon]
MTFKLFLSKKAAGYLERISNDDKRRIVEKLKLLEGNPYILPYKKIRGREGTYRIRVGDFRIRFSVNETDILILKVGRREGIYKQ